jgi:hypothetical protein
MFSARIVVCLVMTSWASMVVSGEHDRPSYNEMRRYVISQLTDEQIMRLHEESVVEYEEFKREEQEIAERNAAKQREKYSRCDSDVVYKERHRDECRRPDFIYELPSRYSSQKELFEDKLMGVCGVMKTVSDARKFGCLPPD